MGICLKKERERVMAKVKAVSGLHGGHRHAARGIDISDLGPRHQLLLPEDPRYLHRAGRPDGRKKCTALNLVSPGAGDLTTLEKKYASFEQRQMPSRRGSV